MSISGASQNIFGLVTWIGALSFVYEEGIVVADDVRVKRN